jgi:predicted porin
MQKKLIAVAVAGALAAPAAALAQSTVQIYGTAYMEWGFINQGPDNTAAPFDPANPDVLQAPGSAVGFKGEEKLGGGMSAWFQCESSADLRGINQDGFCSRNSAVGLKGSFGNFFVGIWDTPFKRTRVGNVGARDTGVFGTGHLLYGASTSTTDGASPGVHSRRQRNSINYDTPVFGGFQGMISMSSTNASTGLAANASNAKERTVSVGGLYRSGPLAIGVGYTENSKAYNNVVTGWNGDEDAWHINAAYQLGSVKLGGAYTKQESDVAAGASAEVQAWHLGAEWKVAGPHNVHFGYTLVDDMEGTATAAMGTRPVVAGVAGGPAVGDSGAKLWQIKYVHNLSKRTNAGFGYTHLKNDRNANYNLGGLGSRNAGSKNKGFVFNVEHRF